MRTALIEMTASMQRAEEAATMDVWSGGQFTLGVGLAHRDGSALTAHRLGNTDQ